MDAHRVEVFHVADGDGIATAIADDFILDLFPAGQVFFDEDLRYCLQYFADALFELLGVFDPAGAKPAQAKTGTHHDGVADGLGGS